MTLNAWNGLPDPEAPKNLREGEPYNDPKFEELARTHGIWGTAQSALCAQFWQAARRAQVVPQRCDLCKNNGGYFYGRTGYEPCCVGSLAPQPPDAAPVQMPEPVAKIEGGSLKWHIPDAGYNLPVRYLQGTQMLYTEHQVRQLLAAHSIQEHSA